MSIEALVARYGLAALFLGAGIEGETVVVAGGLLSHEGFFPLPAAMIAAGAGSFVADQLFFAGGRRYREHRWVKKMQGKPAFARALAALERRPIGFIFAFRFIYGLRTVSPVAIGTSQIRTRTFLGLNAAAAAVWGVLFSAIGYVFGREFEDVLRRLKPSHHDLVVALGALAAMLATAFVIRAVMRRLQ